MSNPQARAQPKLTPRSTPKPISSSSRYLPAQTFTYIASWRGQLLVCTVVLVLGAVYFIVRAPILAAIQRRREKVSRARQEELVSLESEKDKDKDKDMEADKKERGREKKKNDLRKRKGSLLKVPNGSATDSSVAAGPSSLESSPAPRRPASAATAATVTASKSPSRKAQARGRSTFSVASTQVRLSDLADVREDGLNGSAIIRDLTSPPRIRISSNGINDYSPAESSSLDRSTRHDSPTSMLPLPLPVSPYASSSRALCGDDLSDISDLGIDVQSGTHKPKQPKSSDNGFSIIPEEGYLPERNTVTPSAKSRRRKGKSSETAGEGKKDKETASSADELTAALRRSPRPAENGHSSSPSPAGRPEPPHRTHSRKSSLALRPPNATHAQLSELLDERELIIDQLRAEIGVAKAEEAKARDASVRSRQGEDRFREQTERLKRAQAKSEAEGRRREAELNGRLSQLTQLYTAAVHRIHSTESTLRELSTMPLPSPIHLPMSQPFLSGHPSSPYVTGMPSPMHLQGQRPYAAYPSPGLYASPSPMLHPHPQIHHSPSLYRRASTSDSSADLLAGPLTPGTNSPYTLEMTTIPRPSLSSASASQTQLSAELRKQSIESSVMKKKAPVSENGSGSSRQAISPGPIAEESAGDVGSNGAVAGLGVGEIPGLSFTATSVTNNLAVSLSPPDLAHSISLSHSHPSSPSPQPRLITPAEKDQIPAGATNVDLDLTRRLRQIGHVNGNGHTPVSGSDVESNIRDLGGHSRGESDGASDNGSVFGSGSYPHSQRGEMAMSNGTSISEEVMQAHNHNEEGDEPLSPEMTNMPMFASLAHTPEQVAQMRKMSLKVGRKHEEDERARGRGSPVSIGGV